MAAAPSNSGHRIALPSSSSKSAKRFFFNFQIINAITARAPRPPATDKPMTVDVEMPPPPEGGEPVGEAEADELDEESELESLVCEAVTVTSTAD